MRSVSSSHTCQRLRQPQSQRSLRQSRNRRVYPTRRPPVCAGLHTSSPPGSRIAGTATPRSVRQPWMELRGGCRSQLRMRLSRCRRCSRWSAAWRALQMRRRRQSRWLQSLSPARAARLCPLHTTLHSFTCVGPCASPRRIAAEHDTAAQTRSLSSMVQTGSIKLLHWFTQALEPPQPWATCRLRRSSTSRLLRAPGRPMT